MLVAAAAMPAEAAAVAAATLLVLLLVPQEGEDKRDEIRDGGVMFKQHTTRAVVSS